MQSIEKINLENLKKCDQVWEEMTPTDKGRICQKCQNRIIDFRGMTDTEVAEIHVFKKGKICGLYNEEQLKFSNSKNQKKVANSFLIGLLGILSTTNVSAKEEVTPIKIEQGEVNNEKQSLKSREPITNSIKDSVIVSGVMTDEVGEVLIGAAIIIKNTKIGTTTDLNGFYSIEISEQMQINDEVILEFSYTGYTSEEIIIKKDDLINNKSKLNVTMTHGEIIEFYVVTKLPLHKRIWNGIKRIFKKKR